MFKYDANQLTIMKNVNVVFETKEHEQLVELKKKRTWRDYILELAGVPKTGENQ